jgi:hypothetical protein
MANRNTQETVGTKREYRSCSLTGCAFDDGNKNYWSDADAPNDPPGATQTLLTNRTALARLPTNFSSPFHHKTTRR